MFSNTRAAEAMRAFYCVPPASGYHEVVHMCLPDQLPTLEPPSSGCNLTCLLYRFLACKPSIGKNCLVGAAVPLSLDSQKAVR